MLKQYSKAPLTELVGSASQAEKGMCKGVGRMCMGVGGAPLYPNAESATGYSLIVFK